MAYKIRSDRMFSPDQIRFIRSWQPTNGESLRTLADRFGVSKTHIIRIRQREAYRDVDGVYGWEDTRETPEAPQRAPESRLDALERVVEEKTKENRFETSYEVLKTLVVLARRAPSEEARKWLMEEIAMTAMDMMGDK